MLTIEEALKIILKTIAPLPPEEIPLTESFSRILAEDIHSDADIPLTDNSAMDGYAVRAADTASASRKNPKTLEVIEDVRAGYLPSRDVGNAQSARIMTGATIPQGADSVVMVEETEKCKLNKVNPVRSNASKAHVTPATLTSNGVKIFHEAKPGDHVRKRGEDIKNGELVIHKGATLNSARVGMLASVGRSKVKVARKPRIAVLATGDEVIDVDEKLEPGKLRSSNTYSLYSLILKCGGMPKNLGISKDEPKMLRERIAKGLDCDIVLTCGGVSVGDYDLVKDILAEMGTDIKFWKIAMKPGKPLTFGVIQGIPVFGLPGNPVSSIISFEVFVKPALIKMLGKRADDGKEVEAVLDEGVEKRKGLRYFMRARTTWENGTYVARTTGPQGSGILKSMVLANSLLILPEEETLIRRGTKVKVRFLD